MALACKFMILQRYRLQECAKVQICKITPRQAGHDLKRFEWSGCDSVGLCLEGAVLTRRSTSVWYQRVVQAWGVKRGAPRPWAPLLQASFPRTEKAGPFSSGPRDRKPQQRKAGANTKTIQFRWGGLVWGVRLFSIYSYKTADHLIVLYNILHNDVSIPECKRGAT